MRLVWAKDKSIDFDVEKEKFHEFVEGKEIKKQGSSSINYIKKSFAQIQSEETQYQGECRICRRQVQLRSLDYRPIELEQSYDQLLLECFGLRVRDSSHKICDQCAEMIRHIVKFKKVLFAAFSRAPSESSSENCVAEYDSIDDPIPRLEGDQRIVRPNRPLYTKKLITEKSNVTPKKTIIECSVCRQRYPMISKEGKEFVCSRCKISRISERIAVCIKCKAPVPVKSMKQHLESHNISELKGRTRLRSLQKKPSKVQTVECIAKKQKKQLKPPLSDSKKVPVCQSLTAQMKGLQEESATPFSCSICGKDMKREEYLEHHKKIHRNSLIFECPNCCKIFKTKFAFQKHFVRHQNTLK